MIGVIADFAIPMDHHVKEKEEEKIDKYMDLAAEVRRQFRVKTVIVPIVLGALGTVPAKLSKSLEKLEIDNVIGSSLFTYNFLLDIYVYISRTKTDRTFLMI